METDAASTSCSYVNDWLGIAPRIQPQRKHEVLCTTFQSQAKPFAFGSMLEAPTLEFIGCMRLTHRDHGV